MATLHLILETKSFYTFSPVIWSTLKNVRFFIKNDFKIRSIRSKLFTNFVPILAFTLIIYRHITQYLQLIAIDMQVCTDMRSVAYEALLKYMTNQDVSKQSWLRMRKLHLNAFTICNDLLHHECTYDAQEYIFPSKLKTRLKWIFK